MTVERSDWPDPMIVDAFNCMRSGWPWATPAELVDGCVRAVADGASPHVVVFDGPVDGSLAGRIPEGVWVELVGSDGRTADDVIVDLVEAMSAAGIVPTIATSDRGLRDRLAAHPHHLRGGGAYARHLGIH